MTICSFSARRRYFERSSLTSLRGTLFMSLASLSQPVIRVGFRDDGDDPDAAIANIVEDSDFADPKAKLWAPFACKALDPGAGDIGRLMAQMALQPVSDLRPAIHLSGA